MRKSVLIRLALVLAFMLVAIAATGCTTPDQIEMDIMPFTTQPGAANEYRSGLDVHDSQASWVEAGPSYKGPVKYIAEDDTVSTITTQALSGWTAIGGRDGSHSYPLVAYRTDESGVHIVNPLNSVEETFLAGIVPEDFGERWVAFQSEGDGTTELRVVDIETGDTSTPYDTLTEGAFGSVRIQESWLSWNTSDTIKTAYLVGTPVVHSAPVVGTDVTVERVWNHYGALSWTEQDGSGKRKIYYRPSPSDETTEIAPGVKSKDMGGFDGNYVTWFEDYCTPSVRTRAVAVQSYEVHQAGDQLTYAGYDPTQFAWDFETFLWQQRGTNKLFLTRFRPTPPRIVGGNRFDTLANMAKLRAGLDVSGDVEQVSGAITAGEVPVKASLEADSLASVWGYEVVVTAGYDNGSPDAIVAPGLCGVYGAPLLLTNYRSVPASTKEAIVAIRDANKGRVNIHVIGGTTAVSSAAYRQLSALKGTGTIDRIGGRDRYTTAALVAYRMKSVLASHGDTMPAEAMILNGSYRSKWIDAASTGAISAGQHIPVLFVRRNSVPLVTKTALTKLRLSRRYIIGGTGNVSDRVRHSLKVAKADRIYGRDTYRTSTAVVRWGRAKGWLTPDLLFIAGHLHEALAAGALGVAPADLVKDTSVGSGVTAASLLPWSVPVVLTAPRSLNADLEAYIRSEMAGRGLTVPLLVGGEYSVSSTFVRRLLEIMPYWHYRI